MTGSAASRKETTADGGDQSPTSDGAEVYPVADLIEQSVGFLGVQAHVAAGALHGRKADLTIDDAKARVDAWLKAPLTKEA